MPTETMIQACARLHARGYEQQVRAEEDGLRFLGTDGASFAPEDLKVDEVVRLEGTSAPDEQVTIYALCSPDGALRATYCVSHGPDLDPLDVDMVRRLAVEPDTHRSAPEADDTLRQQF